MDIHDLNINQLKRASLRSGNFPFHSGAHTAAFLLHGSSNSRRTEDTAEFSIQGFDMFKMGEPSPG
jgi:hypothetical protein